MSWIRISIQSPLLSAILLGFPSFAQENKFKAGILGGTTLSQIHGDRIGGFNKIGIHTGAFVYADLSEKTSVGFEMYYIQKGSRMPPSKNNPYYWSIRLNYIEIPVVFRYNYKKLFGEIGLSYGRLVNQKFLDNGIEYTPPDFRVFNKNELAALIGVKYQWKENLSFSARVSESIWKTRDYSFTLPRYNFYNINTGTVNFVLNFAVYYQIPLKNNNG